jgi:hypothetical protein
MDYSPSLGALSKVRNSVQTWGLPPKSGITVQAWEAPSKVRNSIPNLGVPSKVRNSIPNLGDPSKTGAVSKSHLIDMTLVTGKYDKLGLNFSKLQ